MRKVDWIGAVVCGLAPSVFSVFVFLDLNHEHWQYIIFISPFISLFGIYTTNVWIK